MDTIQSELPGYRSLLPGYRILRQVGHDQGSATVYQAQFRGRGPQLNVALKVTTVGRASHEARLLARLRHPGIPRFYELIIAGTDAYVAMEFIEGESLAQYLQNFLCTGRLPPVRQVLALGMQLCTVLDYLHTCHPPITFRDVKPGNVMRTPSGRIVLIDFDIACSHLAMQDDDYPVAGTPGYMAPELLGRVPAFSPCSDAFGLGATLFHLLTGRLLPALLEDAAYDGAFALLPPSLRQLLLWLLERDPRRRPADMRAVGAMLRQLLTSLEKRRHCVARLIQQAQDTRSAPSFPIPRVTTRVVPGSRYPAYRRGEKAGDLCG